MACMIVSRLSSSLLEMYCLLTAFPLPLLVPALAPLEAERFAFLAFERYLRFLAAVFGKSGDFGVVAEVEGVGVACGDRGADGARVEIVPGGSVCLRCLIASCVGRVVRSIEGRCTGTAAFATGSVGLEV